MGTGGVLFFSSFFLCVGGGGGCREERGQRLKGCLLTQIKWNFVDKQSKSISNVRLLRNDYICQLLSISRKTRFHVEFPDTMRPWEKKRRKEEKSSYCINSCKLATIN